MALFFNKNAQPSPWAFSFSLERAQSTRKSPGTSLRESFGDVAKFRAKSIRGRERLGTRLKNTLSLVLLYLFTREIHIKLGMMDCGSMNLGDSG